MHVLVLVLVPSPQETEQSPQGVHSVYPPSTARRAIENRQKKITDIVETNTVKDTNDTYCKLSKMNTFVNNRGGSNRFIDRRLHAQNRTEFVSMWLRVEKETY